MPPKKRVKRPSDAITACEDAEPQRRSSRPTRGVGGHVAQLKKVGETVMAPTRQVNALNDLEISGSEENPMAPSQLKRPRIKVTPSLFEDTQLTNILSGQHCKEFH